MARSGVLQLWLLVVLQEARLCGSLVSPALSRNEALRIRGGSVAAAEEEENEENGSGDYLDEKEEEAVKSWIMEQIQRRQERVALLSMSLSERGLPFCGLPKPKSAKSSAVSLKAPDWICEYSTEIDPKPCLIWGDAEPGTKVVRPREASNDQWVSLTALNSLRRRDPVKASRLWYDQYLLDLRRFSHEAGPLGLAVGIFLESPAAIRTLAVFDLFLTLFLTRPFIQFLLVSLLASPLPWRHYGLWSPVVHAPLPLKLLIVRQLYILASARFMKRQGFIFTACTELESMLFERYAFISTSSTSSHQEQNDNLAALQPIDRMRHYAHQQILGEKAKQWSSPSGALLAEYDDEDEIFL